MVKITVNEYKAPNLPINFPMDKSSGYENYFYSVFLLISPIVSYVCGIWFQSQIFLFLYIVFFISISHNKQHRNNQ